MKNIVGLGEQLFKIEPLFTMCARGSRSFCGNFLPSFFRPIKKVHSQMAFLQETNVWLELSTFKVFRRKVAVVLSNKSSVAENCEFKTQQCNGFGGEDSYASVVDEPIL